MAYVHAGRHGRLSGSPPATSAKFDLARSIGELWRLVLRSRAPNLTLRLVASIGLVVIGKLAGVWSPVMLGDAINTLTPSLGGSDGVGAAFVGLALAFAGLRLLASCAPYMREIIFTPVSQAAMAQAATETFAHALSLSLDFHQSKQSGALTRIIDRGSRATDFLLRAVVFNLGPTLLELVLAMGVMVLRLNWTFAAAAFGTVLIYTLLTFRITDWRLGHRRDLNAADSRAAGLAVDAMMNYETVKTFGSEERTVGAYSRAMGEFTQASIRSISSLSLLNIVQAAVLGVGLTLMAVMAGLGVANGEMRVGDVTVAILLLTGIYGPLGMLGFNYREIRQAFIDMEQMVALRAAEPEIRDAPDAVDLPPARGDGASIAFEDVSFRHDARSHGLDGVSFAAAPGETVALVGPSGAGKTTTVRLALRLIDPQGGRVAIDGYDLRSLKQSAVRRAVAIVPQDVALFNDTLQANIAFTNPGASNDAVRAAADAAELGPFIDSLPQGLSTRVGERGLKLSGGERQRVGIARALLAEPRLLILDEATSALDGPTEAAIQQTLRKVRRGRTTLVVAHRLSTVADADQILVLRRGRIVERGTHEALLNAGGEYAALWRRQRREV